MNVPVRFFALPVHHPVASLSRAWEALERALPCFAEANGIDKAHRIRGDTTGALAPLRGPAGGSLTVDPAAVIYRTPKAEFTDENHVKLLLSM